MRTGSNPIRSMTSGFSSGHVVRGNIAVRKTVYFGAVMLAIAAAAGIVPALAADGESGDYKPPSAVNLKPPSKSGQVRRRKQPQSLCTAQGKRPCKRPTVKARDT